MLFLIFNPVDHHCHFRLIHNIAWRDCGDRSSFPLWDGRNSVIVDIDLLSHYVIDNMA